VFDIGMPEFMIIAVVALVVLGPERLPDLMRRAGRAYRQMREMSSQLTGEFQRQLEEGMKEVEEVSATVNSAWQDATSLDDSAKGPPPKLRQVPPPSVPASTQADAGPWVLAALHQDSRPEPEAQGAGCAPSPTALPRRLGTSDPVLDDIDALADLALMAEDWPDDGRLAVPLPTTVSAAAAPGSATDTSSRSPSAPAADEADHQVQPPQTNGAGRPAVSFAESGLSGSGGRAQDGERALQL
jgi:Tat protein translocase TatB subunit